LTQSTLYLAAIISIRLEHTLHVRRKQSVPHRMALNKISKNNIMRFRTKAVYLYSHFQTMTLVGAEKMALSILKQVMEEKLTSSNVEIVTITPSAASELTFEFK
jgi:hypothetical protein